MAADPQTDDDFGSMVIRTLLALIVAALTASIPIGIAFVEFLWQQTVSLEKMNETLTMVCQQLEEKKTIDKEQDRRLLEVEKHLAHVKR